jgi:hypothetical protein
VAGNRKRADKRAVLFMPQCRPLTATYARPARVRQEIVWRGVGKPNAAATRACGPSSVRKGELGRVLRHVQSRSDVPEIAAAKKAEGLLPVGYPIAVRSA